MNIINELIEVFIADKTETEQVKFKTRKTCKGLKIKKLPLRLLILAGIVAIAAFLYLRKLLINSLLIGEVNT